MWIFSLPRRSRQRFALEFKSSLCVLKQSNEPRRCSRLFKKPDTTCPDGAEAVNWRRWLGGRVGGVGRVWGWERLVKPSQGPCCH